MTVQKITRTSKYLPSDMGSVVEGKAKSWLTQRWRNFLVSVKINRYLADQSLKKMEAAVAYTPPRTTDEQKEKGEKEYPFWVLFERRIGQPIDPRLWGTGAWRFLHLWAESLPTRLKPAEQRDVVKFIELFGSWLPCGCRVHFQARIYAKDNAIGLYLDPDRKRVNPAIAGTRDGVAKWLRERHNEVNKRLGKKVLDDNTIDEAIGTPLVPGNLARDRKGVYITGLVLVCASIVLLVISGALLGVVIRRSKKNGSSTLFAQGS